MNDDILSKTRQSESLEANVLILYILLLNRDFQGIRICLQTMGFMSQIHLWK